MLLPAICYLQIICKTGDSQLSLEKIRLRLIADETVRSRKAKSSGIICKQDDTECIRRQKILNKGKKISSREESSEGGEQPDQSCLEGEK